MKKPKCKCCGKEISSEQEAYSGLCPLCDTGACQSPKEYHKLEKRYEELSLMVIKNRLGK